MNGMSREIPRMGDGLTVKLKLEMVIGQCKYAGAAGIYNKGISVRRGNRSAPGMQMGTLRDEEDEIVGRI